MIADEITSIFEQQGFEGAKVQLSEVVVAGQTLPAALVRTKPLDQNTGEEQQRQVLAALQARYGDTTRREQIQSVGATVSQESTRSAVIAVLGASLAILRGAKSAAAIQGRDFVVPEDIQLVLTPVLRHRILTNFRAEADGVDVEDIITRLLDSVPEPKSSLLK